MSDPFIHKCKVYVGKFGKISFCDAEITQEAFDRVNLSSHTFSKAGLVLYVGRGEDLYASPHFAGREAVRVTRESFQKGLTDSYRRLM